MPAIFISYRRADSSSIAGRIDDQLVARFGRAQVFKDVDSIPPGVNFERYIEGAIRDSAVVLVVIGPRWLNASAGTFRGRRLDDPADFVRIEIETALRLGVPIIPLLSENAAMPTAARLPATMRPLASLNALAVRPDPDFHRDMERVAASVERRMAAPIAAPPIPTTPTALTTARAQLVTPPPEPQPTRASPTAPRDRRMSAPIAVAEATQRLPGDPRSRDTRANAQRSLRPHMWLTIGGVVALTAVVVIALLSGSFSGLLGGVTTNPGVAATQTTQAYAANTTATARAEAALLAKPYNRATIGPCDKQDPPSPTNSPYQGDGSPAYWSWGGSAGKITCPKGTTITGDAHATFWGLPPNAFPRRFTASFTVAMAPASAGVCVTYSFNATTVGAGLNLCGNGEWTTIYPTISASHYLAARATYRVTLIVTASTLAFKVNGVNTGAPVPYTSQISSLAIEGAGAYTNNPYVHYQPNAGVITITDFALIPTA